MAQARKLLVRALILAVSAGALSAVYQRAADARDRRRFPAPGRLVPVGGDRRLQSTASRHVYAQHGGHNIHLDEPGAVIRALREMIRQCRS